MGLSLRNTATRKATVRGLTTYIPCRSTLLGKRALLGFLLVVLTTARPGSVTAQASPSVKLSPETIQMGAFYNGTTVRIEGAAPPSSSILVIIRGNEKDEFFNKKGRVGPIWINTDKVHIAGVPSVFLSFSSADLNSILDRASIDEYQLDESAIRSHLICRSHCKCLNGQHERRASIASCAGVKPGPEYEDLIRSSFMALKSGNGSYKSYARTVKLSQSAADGSRYALDLDWPRNLLPGSYQVEVYACRNRSVLARATTQLNVAEVGFPMQMAGLAQGHPWTYGVIAVVVAIFAGFAIDAITSRLRRPKGRLRPPKTGGRELAKPEVAEESKESAEEVSPPEPVHRS
jgi:Putative transmembrane protein (Alph_Pro_TM)